MAGNGGRLTGMSFFDSIPQPPPPPEPLRRPRPAWMQPDEVIPGSVPGELMLIRTGQVAVAIGSIRAYPNGFEFTAHVRMHGKDENEPGLARPVRPPRAARQATTRRCLAAGSPVRRRPPRRDHRRSLAA